MKKLILTILAAFTLAFLATSQTKTDLTKMAKSGSPTSVFVTNADGNLVWATLGTGVVITGASPSFTLKAKTWQPRTVTSNVGSVVVTLSGTVPSDVTAIRFRRNGLNYTVGLPGCADCNVVKTGAATFTFQIAAASYDQFTAEVFD